MPYNVSRVSALSRMDVSEKLMSFIRGNRVERFFFPIFRHYWFEKSRADSWIVGVGRCGLTGRYEVWEEEI